MAGFLRHTPCAGELPAGFGECGQDGIGIGGIDRKGLAAVGVVDQDAVIVAQAGELVELQIAHR